MYISVVVTTARPAHPDVGQLDMLHDGLAMTEGEAAQPRAKVMAGVATIGSEYTCSMSVRRLRRFSPSANRPVQNPSCPTPESSPRSLCPARSSGGRRAITFGPALAVAHYASGRT